VAVEKAVEPVVEAGRGRADGVDGERTIARAQVVTDDARVAELSRMLAGTGTSAHARELAAELIAEAAAGRGAPAGRRR
jgi:DNA repair ATPase RecN